MSNFPVAIPINKYLAQDFRATMGTVDAPNNIDTSNPLIAVVDIQKGFPKPNSKQTLKVYHINKAGAADTQVVSKQSTIRVYFVGAFVSMLAGGGAIIGDATSGTLTSTDGATNLFFYQSVAAVTNTVFFPQLPVECVSGIRVSNNGAVGFTATIYYIEELNV